MRPLLVGLLTFLLCSGSSDDAVGSEKEKVEVGNAVEQCDGAFVCSVDFGPDFDLRLTRVGGQCRARGFQLKSNGRAAGLDDVNGRWLSMDASTFDICLERVCMRCAAKPSI